MPKEFTTTFGHDDRLDLHRSPLPRQETSSPWPSAKELALKREQKRTEEFLRSAQGQVAQIGMLTRALRSEHAETESPAQPFGADRGYEETN